MAEVGGISLPITAEAGQANKELDSVTASLGRIENALSGIQKSLEPLSGAANSVSRAVNRLAKDIEIINPDKFQKVANGLKEVASTADKVQSEFAEMSNGLETSAEKSSRAINSLQRDLTNALKSMGTNIDNPISEMATDIQAVAPVISQVTRETERFQQVIENAFKMDMSGNGFDVLQKQLPAVVYGIKQVGESATQVEQKLKGVDDAIPELYKTVESVADAQDSIVQNTSGKIQELYIALNYYKSKLSEMRKLKITVDDNTYKTVLIQVKEITEEIRKYEEEAVKANKAIENGGGRKSQWKDVIAEVEKMKGDFDLLSKSIGEANAEMQILVDARNMLKKAFSDTDSGKVLWDTERMKQGSAMLREIEDKINAVKANISDPAKLEIDITQPINDIEKLFARLRDLNSYISDMKGNKINFTDEEFINAIKEREKIQKRINEIEGKGGGNGKQEKDSLRFLAKIVAIQHELEKVSGMFSKFGDIAKNAFLKALTPLKLIQHEFNELKENITRVGSAFALVSKFIAKVYGVLGGLTKRIRETFNVKNIFKRFVDTASKAFDTITKKWRKVAERFSFTLLRKAINSVINQLNDAMKSLALFSSNIGTDFNSSMSIVTSDIRYLAASIIALLEPLINYFTPILDGLIDQLVNVTNHVNMFIAALTGAKSFTIAKKKIIDYSKALEKANKSAKMLTLGIDELNILNDDKSTEELEDLFEWQELPTPQIDFGFLDSEIVDLIKKILQQIKDLLKAIINAIKEAWRRVADYVLSAAKRLLKAVLKLVSDVLRDLIKLFNEEATIKLLETIFRILGDIMNIIAAIIEKIDEAWNHNNLGLKILEKIRDILLVIATHIQNVTEYMVGWAESLTFIPLFESFLNLLNQIEYAVDQIGKVFEDVMISLVLPLIKYLIEDAFPKLLDILSSITHAIGNIAKNFHEAWQDVNFGELLTQDITGVTDTILKHLQTIADEFDNWSIDINFRPVMFGIDEVLSALQPLVDAIGNIFDDVFRDVIFPLFTYLIEDVIPKLLGVIADIETAFANLADGIHKAWNELDFGSGVMDGIKGIVDTLLKYVGEIGEYFKDWAKQVDFKPLLKGFENLLKALKPVADFVGDVALHAFEALMKYVQHLVEDIFPEWENAIATIANSTNWQTLKETFNSLIDAGEHLLEAIGGGVVKAVENLGIAVAKFADSSAFKEFIKNITDFITKIDADMVAKVLTGIGLAILKIAEAITKFVNSKLVQDFLNALLRFINDSSAEKIADVLLNIAGAFLAFKGISVALKGLSTALSAIALIGNATEGVKKIAEVFKGAKTAADAAEVATKGVATAAKGVGEATKAAAAGAGEVTTALEGTTTAATGASGALSGIGSAIGTVIQTISGIAAIIGGAILAVKEFVDMWKDGWDIIKTILEALGIALAAVGAVLLGAPAAVAAAVAGIVFAVSQLAILIHQHFEEIVSFIKECWNGITEFFNELWSGIVSLAESIFSTLQEFFTILWSSIVEGIMLAWSGVTEFLSEVWNGIVILAQTIFAVLQEFFTNLWNGIVEIFTSVWSTLQEFLTTLWTELTNLGLELWGNLRDFILNVWSSLQEAAETAWNFINELLTTIWNFLSELAQTVFGGIHDLIVNSWNFIKGLAEEVWNFVRDLLISTWEGLVSFISEAVQTIQDAIVGAWEFIVNKTKEIWQDIQSFLSGLWESIKQTAEQIWSAIKDVLEGIWNGIVNAAKEIFSGINEFLSGVWDGIKEAWESLWNAIHGMLEELWNKFVELAHSIWDGITEFFKTIWDGIKEAWNEAWGFITKTISDIWNKIVDGAHKLWEGVKDFFVGLWDDVADKWKSIWSDIGNFIKDIANGIVGVVEGVINCVIGGVNKIIDLLNNLSIDIPDNPLTGAFTLGFSIPKIPELNIPRFATGGFPEDGLFYANHNELVGEFSNGRTAVVNNSQIEAGIAQAVASAMTPYLEQIARNTGITADKDMSIQIDSREIARANNTGSRNLGRSLTSLS